MRKSSKIIALVLALVMIFSMIPLTSVSAASQPEYLYLTPNANWKTQSARFAAYFFGNGETWVSMTDADKDGVYEVKVPTAKTYPNVIFCRMNPSATANNWNNKWNQTGDLVIPTSGANHYTVKEGTWDKGGGTWSTYGSTCAHANLGPAATCTTAQTCLDCGDPVVSALGHTYNSAHLCTRCNEQASFTVAGSGAHLGTEWDTGNKANDMTYADGVYTKVYTNVAAGSYKLKVARDHDWGTAYPSADKAYTVSKAGSTVTVTLKGTTVNVVVEAPHTCAFVDGVCSCGEFDPAWTVVATLEELNAALLNGGNIVLNGDITSSDVISITTSVVLNGNGHTLTYTGANRAIDVPNTAVDVNLTIKNLTVNTTASFCERGINYNTNGVLTLEKVAVAGTNINYAINLPGSSDNATVVITDSNITGNIALNVWGEKVAVTANNSNFTSPYESEVEVCSVIQFNNDGTNAAHGASLTVNGGSIISLAETVALSVSSYDTVISISNETTVQGKQETSSIAVIYEGQTQFYTSSTLQHAFDLAANDPRAKVLLLGDVVLDAPIVVTGTVVLDLNGYTLSYTSTTMGEAMITNKGNLTINDSVGTGVINYNYVGANDASYGKGNYTISNGGTLTVNGGKITIANLRQHAKYPIDNNSTTGDAILVINGGHLYNYNTSAIRMFCNSTTYKNSVTINGGLIEGYSAIWMQNPGKNTVHGALTITGGEIRTTAAAYVNGTAELKDVSSKLYCTIDGEGGAWSEDSLVAITGGTFNENVYLATNAPANLSIGEGATFNGYMASPAVYVAQVGDVKYETLAEAIAAAQAGDTVLVYAGTYALPSMKAGITIEGVGEVIFEGTLSGTLENLTLKNLHIKGSHAQRWAYAKGNLVFENVTFEATSVYALHFDGITEGATLLYKNCTIIGWAAMSGSPASCVFDGCTIKGNGSYGLIRTYFDATIENCTFDISNVNPDDVYQDGIHAVDATVTVNNCTNVNGEMSDIIDTSNVGYVVLDGETIHIHKFVAGETVAPTCTEAGYTPYVCPCGHTEKRDEVVALGHSYTDGVCENCGEEEPHTHKDTGLDAKCDECGEYFVPASPFKLGMYQKNKGGTFFFKGSMSGYYLATTNVNNVSGAVDVYAEETDGGYYLYFMSGTTKNYLYIQLSGTHINAKYGSTKAVWEFDKTYGIFVTTVSGAKYFYGTYSNYVTMGGTAYTRLSASTVDVSQFVARPISLADHVCSDFTTKVTNPTCTAQGYTTKTCKACGVATKVDYVDALGHDLVDVEALAPTCTAAGYSAHKDCSRCTYTEGKETVAALGHDYNISGVCTRCEAVDPNYNPYIINFSQWPEFAKETYADGDTFKLNDVFTFIMGKNSRVDASSKTWDDFEGTLRFSFGGKTPTGSVPSKNALQITADGSYIIKIWYVAGGDGRYFALMDQDGAVLSETTKETVKNGQDYAELVIPAAGTYYFGVPADNNYIFQIELVKHEHAYTDVVTAPTCTEAGYTTHTCDCGHSYKDTEVEALGHDLTVLDAVAPTCTETGLTAGESCSRCDHKVEQTVVDALGHDIVVDEAVAPTCTETGLTAGEHCSRCDHKVEQTVVDALGHDIVADAAVDATCTETGLTAGEHCSRCDHKVEQTVVDALDHSFEEGACTRCGEADPDYVPEQPPVDDPVVDPQPEPEVNFFQMILDLLMKLFEMIKNLFKF